MIRDNYFLEERWVPVARYEGFYEVSDGGRVRSLDRTTQTRDGKLRRDRGVVLRAAIGTNKHMSVVLSRNSVREQFQVHRLVALAFCPGYHPQLEVCHNDGDPVNNNAENLRWDTHSSNVLDSVRHGTYRNGWGKRTHCKRNHPFDAQNTYWYNGYRSCRACTRLMWHRRKGN